MPHVFPAVPNTEAAAMIHQILLLTSLTTATTPRPFPNSVILRRLLDRCLISDFVLTDLSTVAAAIKDILSCSSTGVPSSCSTPGKTSGPPPANATTGKGPSNYKLLLVLLGNQVPCLAAGTSNDAPGRLWSNFHSDLKFMYHPDVICGRPDRGEGAVAARSYGWPGREMLRPTNSPTMQISCAHVHSRDYTLRWASLTEAMVVLEEEVYRLLEQIGHYCLLKAAARNALEDNFVALLFEVKHVISVSSVSCAIHGHTRKA